MNTKAKKELKEKEIYVRFEKLAKRLRKERKELDANEFWKFLILELDQAITKARKEVFKEISDWAKKGKLSVYPVHYFIAGLKQIEQTLKEI